MQNYFQDLKIVLSAVLGCFMWLYIHFYLSIFSAFANLCLISYFLTLLCL